MDINGVIVIDKPGGITSHDVVSRVRRLLGERSVGHLGTLDPMATGVLPLVLGRMTRLAQFYTGSNKAYEGEIRFGFATSTYDAESEPIAADNARDPASLTLEELREAAGKFRGKILQTPPPFSAKKIQGVPAYKLARKKQDVLLQAVEVEVPEFDILSYEGDRATFRAKVSSGTYVRSIAHDLGQALGTGAHLTALRRTQVAEFALEDAHTLEQLEAAMAHPTELLVHPRRILLSMPGVTASAEAIALLRNGRAVNLPEMSDAPLVKVFADQSLLLAVCQRIAGTLFQPKVVLFGSNEPMPVR